ncbi:EF-P 5-aminopentanol modification-associated protein YfmF [Staphylococcus felis]|uniref:EF-P 5-aminopentanol modification-associated protein YfmF n=1 Tax=Staphylococcus felis TaxID=46127 RepID=UPI0039671816
MLNHKNSKNSNIRVYQTNKFKTATITFKFMAPLDTQTMTKRSLLSKLLVRATKKYPTDKSLNQYLSKLYGAYLNSYVSKFKDRHVITIALEIVNERYLLDDEPLLEKGIALLKEVILNPLIINESFDETYVRQEKSLLKKKLAALEDNKSQIAFIRLLKHMFGDHPYRYMAAGELNMIDDVTASDIFETYVSMLENDYCSVYIVGNVDQATATKHIESEFNVKPFTYETIQFKETAPQHQTPNEIIETDDVDQAKLNMGFRFNTSMGHPDFYALVVFNMMFGGDPSSVLFNEVREQKSLAYSIHSQIDGKNGFLFVTSGVSTKEYVLAKDTIIEAFEKFRQGQFSDEQLNLAKKIILSHRKEGKDRPKSITEMMHNQILMTLDEPFETKISNVSKKDIQRICTEAIIDTTYILTKRGEANA